MSDSGVLGCRHAVELAAQEMATRCASLSGAPGQDWVRAGMARRGRPDRPTGGCWATPGLPAGLLRPIGGPNPPGNRRCVGHGEHARACCCSWLAAAPSGWCLVGQVLASLL